MTFDFSRCRSVWVPPTADKEGFWSPPFEHVKDGVRWIIDHPYALLADDMGGMKTAQSIIAAQFLHDAGVIDRVIVVAPASVRPKVWFDQDLGQLVEQAFDDKRIVAIEYHAKVKRWERGPKDALPLTFYLTNYEFIRGRSNLQALLPYCTLKTLLILDESSAVRVWDSQQTEACMLLRWRQNAKGRPVLGAPRCGRILEMNGTPVAEGPMDMFSQGNLLHPDILQCRYVTHYKARYAVQEAVLGYGGKAITTPQGRPVQRVSGWTNLDDLTARFAPYVLRREAKQFGVDFALPPVGFDVPLTESTWRIYQDMKREMVAWLKSGVATAAQAGVRSIRLAQITSGFVGGVEDPNIGEWIHEPSGEVDASDLRDLIACMSGGAAYNTDDIEHGKMTARPGAVAADKIGERPKIEEISREKLDFALEWHAALLKRYPDLKLLFWCRFVHELRRMLREERLTFPGIPAGAACGEKIFEGEHNQKSEREHALRLLHPKTAPSGPATVGATQGTGAIGLNFTACRTVLDVSYDYSPWKKRQGDARVNRTGQTGPVSFFYLVATGPRGQRTIDHTIMMMRLGKMEVNDLTVAGWVKALEE